jgi:hypothetical protein
MALQSIFQNSLVDNHKDCFDGRSMINVKVTELISELESNGFSLVEHKEQRYNRQETRARHGVYSVFLTCAAFPELALMIVDSKDCQTSLRLYVALKSNSDYYPIKLVSKFRHNKKNSEQFEAIKLYITEIALSELSKVNKEFNSVDYKELTENQLIEFSDKLTSLKRVNYKASEAICLVDYKAINSLKDACLQLSVKWLPHQLKYCCEAYKMINEA